jgi:type IV secretion system protein VirB5
MATALRAHDYIRPIDERADVPPESKQQPSTNAASHNPYLAARREWDERYGNLITRERNWRRMALICALMTLVAIGGLVRVSSQSHVVPFVVALDSLGRTVAAGPATETSVADDRLKRSTLFTWIENLRMVTTDGVAQRKAIDRVYAHIASGAQAQAFISEFYRNDPPQKRAQNETVAVEVRSVLPTSDRTFEVEWREVTRDLYGAVKSQELWKASLTIAMNPPKDERLARINPLGIYVTNANWGKIL